MKPIASLLVVLSLFSGAQVGEALTLNDAYQQASQYDAGLKVARERKAAALEQEPQSWARNLPNLSSQLNHSYIMQRKTLKDRYNDVGYTLTLNTPIFHMDNIIDLRQASKETKKAVADFAAAEQDLVMRVARAYFDYLQAQDTLALSEAELKSMQARLDTVKESFRVGAAVVTDLHEAQASFDLAQTGTIDASNKMQSAQEAMLELIGQEAQLDKSKPLPAKIPLVKPDPVEMEAWVKTALEKNPQAMAANLEWAIAKDKKYKAMAGHLPTVDLVMARTQHDNEGPPQWLGGFSRTDTIMFLVNIPIFAGGGVVSQVAQASHGAGAAEHGVEMVQRKLTRQTRDAYRAVVTGISQVKAMEKIVASTQEKLQTTEAGQQAGIRNMIQVLDAERESYRMKRDFAAVRYGYVLSTLGLKQAAGVLSAADLDAIDKW